MTTVTNGSHESQHKKKRKHEPIPVGTRFGMWVVTGYGRRNRYSSWEYPCRCDCGTQRYVKSVSLRGGKSTCCGCVKITVEPLRQRLMRHINITESGCWEFQGYIDKAGYGKVSVGNDVMLAHRAFYKEFVGEVPDGMYVVQDCERRVCCNPEHLVLRSRSDSTRMRSRGTCRRGHSKSEYGRVNAKGHAYCRKCETENQSRRNRLKREWAKGHDDVPSVKPGREAEMARIRKRRAYQKNPDKFKHRAKERQNILRANGNGRPITTEEWGEVLDYYGHVCAYCGKSSKVMERDHVTPVSRGGPHIVTNLVPSCRRCNRSKGAHSLMQWLWSR